MNAKNTDKNAILADEFDEKLEPKFEKKESKFSQNLKNKFSKNEGKFSEFSESKNGVKSYIYPFINRFLHAFLIISFALAYALADAQQGFYLHAVFGTLFFAAALARVLWGFVGTRFSRFADFEFRGLFGYFRTFFRPQTPYTAHNPASSYAIVAMLFLGLLLGLSGLLLWGTSEQKGVFGGLYFAYNEFYFSLHEIAANALLAVVCLHICGALLDKFYHKFQSLNAIISGFKRTLKDESVRLNAAQKALCAFFVLGLGLLYFYLANPQNALLNARQSPKFTTQTEPYALYKKECGSCHIAYAPYLLPKKAWANLMDGLENHFGDDASLEETDFEGIASFLNAHSSEAYESFFKANLADENESEIAISKYKFYEKAHETLPQGLFKAPNIKSKANCNACHEDGEQGFFGKSGIKFDEIKKAKSDLSGDN